MSSFWPPEPRDPNQPTQPMSSSSSWRSPTPPTPSRGANWRQRVLLGAIALVALGAIVGSLLVFAHLSAQANQAGVTATATDGSGVLASGTATAGTTPDAGATATTGPQGQPTATRPPTSVPSYSHVFLIVMENTWYGSIVGSGNAPYINGTLIPNGALATNYYALTHPSAPNYWALTSGQIPQSGNCDPPGKNATTPQCMWNIRNLSDELASAGKSWSAYYEDMYNGGAPQDCFANRNASSNWTYTPNYNPWINYTDVNPSGCAAHDVPMPTSPSALASAVSGQNFAMISPNLCHDMHNCSINTGDTWLQQNVSAIQHSSACTQQSCLIVVTWDEDDTSSSHGNPNQVATMFWGSTRVHAGHRDGTHYTHYALLHTVERALGLGTLTANDAGAPLMTGMFS